MKFSNLTSYNYLKCSTVLQYKLKSESNVKTVYVCQNVTLASNLRSCCEMLTKRRREELSSAKYMCAPKPYIKCFTLDSSCWRRRSEGNLQYIFLRCLRVKTLHFLSLPICQIPVERWIHSSKFWKKLLAIKCNE